jgi:hypothetical protein
MDTQKMDNFSKAMEHFAKGLALMVLEGMTDVNGTVKHIPAAFDLNSAADYIGIGKTSLLQYRDAGRIRTYEVGGRPKYYREDLDKLLREIKKEQA